MHTETGQVLSVYVTRHGGGKSLGANDRGPTKVDRANRRGLVVGGGFELAVNRKLSVARTHKTAYSYIHFFTGAAFFRPATSLTKFQRGQEFCVLFSGIFSTLVSNILSLTVFFARRDFFSFFLTCRSRVSFAFSKQLSESDLEDSNVERSGRVI